MAGTMAGRGTMVDTIPTIADTMVDTTARITADIMEVTTVPITADIMAVEAAAGGGKKGAIPDPRPKDERSNEFKFGARHRARLLMTNWCLSNKDSATTAFTPPGRASLAMVDERQAA